MRERIRAVLAGTVDYEAALDALTVTPSAEVDPELMAAKDEAFTRLWRGGWQPAELHRVVTRRGRPHQADLVTDAIAAHLRQFPRATVDERWQAQADVLGARIWWTGDATYVHELATRWRLDRVAVLDLLLGLLAILATLPPIEMLIAPPGSAEAPADGASAVTPSRIDARQLDRVRALLAKAESTTFPAEAETYTAKAQELVTRHSLDEALLAARSGDAAPVMPYARRIGLDHPHDGEKAALLEAIAQANRCHTVWSPELAFSTVFGFDTDIDAVDLLYTSLLVQAHRAMARVEPPGGKAGRSRLRAFRQSFLVAFTARIDERLTSAAQLAFAQATGGGETGESEPADLLPVLASRDEQIRETMRRVFPHTVRARATRVDSHEGWTSGRQAADRATLSTDTTRGR
ncbi:DUF2786 domain-containing protein [Micromonospora zingiberis]|uniref:DUF2786 domain-containing protein n=1 Tax=Micromonospora zingiberis TaxID=2053011 RepID=A0A4R0GP25_9ACTN|nr:DUF2786 domain-containing protein [Micromonospora zingiberis]